MRHRRVVGAVVIGVSCVCTSFIAISQKADKQAAAAIATTQVAYLPDVAKAPTADQYNGLLHALQNSHLMATDPGLSVPKSNWLHWWPFP